MKKVLAALIILIVFVSVSVSQTKTIRINEKNTKNISVKNTENGFIINTNISELTFKNKKGKSENFYKLSSPGLIKTFGKGLPELPVYSKLIEIPQEATVKISVTSYKEQTINLTEKGINNKIFPAQLSVRKDKDPADIPFFYNRKIYDTDKFFSLGDIAIFEYAGQMRDIRMGRIEIRPFEYNPVTNQLKVYNNLQIKIEFEGANLTKTEEIKRKYGSPFTSSLNSSFLYKIKNNTKELIQYAPQTFVIVSDTLFRNALQPFVQWKTMKGFNVIEAYTDAPDVGNTVASIKAYLQDLYYNPPAGQNPPSFILVVGDIEQIPATQHTEVSSSPYSDLDLAEYTGDYLPEVNFGRWSAEDAATVEDIVYKTVRYEKLEMADPSYLEKTFLVAGDDEGNEDTWGGGAVWYADNYYMNADHNIENHLWLQNTIESWPNGNSQAHDSIIYMINQGVAWANYTAHCSPDGWYEPSFTQNDLNNNITNFGKYGLWIGNCCQSFMFNVNESFGEIALRKPDAGVIGYIGGSQYTYWDEDYYWGVGVADESATPSYDNSTAGCYDGLFHDGANEINDISTWFTTNYQFIKAGNLAVQASTSGRKAYYWVIYQLSGDPSITPFVGTPQPMAVTAGNLILGVSELAVSSAPYSYVALSQNGTLIAAAVSDEAGNALLSFDAASLSEGDADLTVTAQNRIPYIGTVTVAPADQPFIVLKNYAADISPDYGKTISLNVTLENLAGSGYDAVNTNATLSSSDTYFTIIDGTENYGDIAAGTAKTVNNAFSVSIADNVPDQYTGNLDLTVTGEDTSGNSYTWTSTLHITANAPEITIGDIFVTNDDNNDGILNAGETGDINFTVTNSGHADAGFNGILSEVSDTNNYLTLGETIISPVTIPVSSSNIFTFTNASADINTSANASIELKLDVFAGDNSQYAETSNQNLTLEFIPEYCAASGGCDEYISNVTIGDIDNTSNCDQYADYSNLSTNVEKGNTYTLTVNVGNSYSSDALTAYVDWNYDGDFLDENESFPMTWSNPVATADITVPENAKEKPLKLRIRLVYNSVPAPCGTTKYGEVEDYTLNVTGNTTSISNRYADNKTVIIPNPNNGIFILKSESLNLLNSKVEIYSVSGKLIYENKINSDNFEINLSNQAKGIYFIKVTSGKQVFNSKLIIK